MFHSRSLRSPITALVPLLLALPGIASAQTPPPAASPPVTQPPAAAQAPRAEAAPAPAAAPAAPKPPAAPAAAAAPVAQTPAAPAPTPTAAPVAQQTPAAPAATPQAPQTPTQPAATPVPAAAVPAAQAPAAQVPAAAASASTAPATTTPAATVPSAAASASASTAIAPAAPTPVVTTTTVTTTTTPADTSAATGSPVPAPPPEPVPEPVPDQTLNTVLVTSSREETPLPTRPSESVYGTNTTILDTPRSVSQVSSKQLKNDVIRTADDLVKYAPGVTRGGGQNVNVAPQIRGQNSELFQDGQRIYSVRHPTNLNAYEGADIVAGVSSVVFGPSSGSGGYTNYITKKPNFEKANTEISGLVGALAPTGGSWNSNRITVDTNNPISDTLAYRVSVTLQRSDDYYINIKNNYNAFYGAIAWKPSDRFRLDINTSYDDYYDYNVTHGWNRLTQRLVDTYGKEYNAGRATPIIETPGVGLWSPVFESGAPDSEVIGWQTREKNADGKFVATGAVNTTPLPNASPTTPGTIRGWVYDPNLRGNDVKSISPRTSARDEDKNTSSRLQTQARATFDISDNLKIVNRFLYSQSRDTTNSVGSFLSQSRDAILDDRLELVGHTTYLPFGLTLEHDNNSGIAFRHEDFYSLAANNSFNINPYDLTQDPSNKTPGGLLGIPNATAASGSWVGAAGQPQQSAFGYVNLPQMFAVPNNLYAERGGSPPFGAIYTGKGWWNTWTLFTQHNFLLNKHFGVNGGLSKSYVRAAIANPVVITPADEYSDEQGFTMNSLQVSPLVKPTDNITLYFTYDRSLSFNTGGFANVLTWGSGNKLNPLAFESVSKLYEGGVKADIIPERLFASAAFYYQERDTSPDINGNMARLETKGAEATVRYHDDAGLNAGLNLSWIAPRFTFIIPAGFSPYGFQADDETVFGDRNVLNQRTGTEYDAAGIPNYSATGYVDYQFPFGLGAELSAWITSSWYTDISENVIVPTQANLDLTVYYRQPEWDIALAATNLTDANNFVNGLAGSATEFLQPMRPLTLQLKGAYRF